MTVEAGRIEGADGGQVLHRWFAASFGFSLDAVQNWEQGRRRSEGAARAFLKVIEREPEAVRRALAA